MSFQIFFPSHRRSSEQHTLDNLPANIKKNITLVVQDSDAWDYEEVAIKHNLKEMVVLPFSIQSLSPTYEHMIKVLATDDKFFIMDDDLRFAFREFEDLGDPSLTKCNNQSVIEDMFLALLRRLETHAHVGVSARAGNNHVACSGEDYTWSENSRMMCLTGYKTDVVKQVETNRVKCRDDFDRHLQLMEMGYANSVLYSFTHDQASGSNSSGGCSEYRDAGMLDEEAHKLASLHPGFVSVKEKKTKADWGVGGVRTDVIIQWKKAFNSSRKV